MVNITRPVYCTRENVRQALDWAPSTRQNARIDREIVAASATIEGDLHRVFYPEQSTHTFDWPNYQYARSWVLWLDQHELISITTLTSGGVEIPSTDYFLRPDDGPPFRRVELDLDSNAAFGGGSTAQRDISITGLYGYRNDEAAAGTLVEALDASETAVDVTDSTAIGVGDLIRVDSERMLVTGKTMLDTGQTLQADIAAATASDSVTVTDGTGYTAGETILLDTERMLVEDIAGNTLIVRRAAQGTTLAAHTAGVTIYAPRTLTVQRGALGTTAASHSDGATVRRWVPPGPVRQLCIAETITTLEQESSGYARVVGSGNTQREARGAGLADVRRQVYTSHGRKARTRAV